MAVFAVGFGHGAFQNKGENGRQELTIKTR
jgi:hypothetical protein